MTIDQQRKFCLVVNPFGGKKQGLAILDVIQPVFDAASIELEIIKTTHARHAYEVANTQSFSGVEGLIVVGGDGTIHEVVNGMMDREDNLTVPLGLVPGGSGNSLLTDLGLLDPLKAAEAIVRGQRYSMDVAEVTLSDQVVYAFNIIGWGLVADVNARAEQLRWMGPVRYTVASLIELVRAKKRMGMLRFDAREFQGGFCFVLACNTKHTGKQMKMAPNAKLDDGLIDLIVVKHGLGILKMLFLFAKLNDGKYINDPAVEYYQVKTFELKPEITGPLNVDGELFGVTPVRVVMKPLALEVYCDPHAG